MTPLYKRHPKVTGAIGLAVLAALLFGAFHIEDLPLIGGGTGYTAALRDASGLAARNEGRVAGVKGGKVTDVSLARGGTTPYGPVDFRIDHAGPLGPGTGATL